MYGREAYEAIEVAKLEAAIAAIRGRSRCEIWKRDLEVAALEAAADPAVVIQVRRKQYAEFVAEPLESYEDIFADMDRERDERESLCTKSEQPVAK